MGKVIVARVDDRLIHGQVMTEISKASGANAIFVVDNLTANDSFMRQIFLSSGTRTGLKIKIFNEDQVVKYWKDKQFDDYKVILLAKTIQTFYTLITGGINIESLNIGNLGKLNYQEGSKDVITTVAITKEELGLLDEMRDQNQVKVYFQTIPSSNSKSLNEADKLFK